MTIPPEIERVALLGWCLYPQSRYTRAACFSGASAAATCDLDMLADWSRRYPGCNWRVKVGPSGLWGIDIDAAGATHQHDGVGAMRELTERYGSLPRCPTTRSGGGGYAVFFQHAGERIIGAGNTPRPGLDPRRGALSVTIPPSIHPVTRLPYRWLIPPWECNPPKAPGWLVTLCEAPPEPPQAPSGPRTPGSAYARLYRAADAVASAAPGVRNATLNGKAYHIGGMVHSGMVNRHDAEQVLFRSARAAGLDAAEAMATIRSGLNAGARRGK
ncbi:MAG: bifunctional DNA primase/polymerase [Patescibacteria group bacterium]|nr:bifunctional DNA primase/polymerase [Patescibacteria group bacterium]